jgi:hypothetical protein
MWLILSFFLAWPPGSQAGKAGMTEIVVTNSTSDVLLYGKIVNGFTPEMEAALQNGIPVTFTFLIELHKVRSSWLDRQIAALAFDHTLSYDSLKEEYRIELQEKGGRTLATRSLAEARAWMTGISGLRVAPLASLQPEEEYLLKIKAKLARKTLPLNVHALIPFWGLWDFETDWHHVEFRY